MYIYSSMNFLLLFLYISIIILLIYNLLITFNSFLKKEVSTRFQGIDIAQKILLSLIFIVIIVHFRKATTIPAQLFLTPWIWGFLTGHIFFKPKKRWLHEFFGLGILLAITIILFFKQENILQYLITKKLPNMHFVICCFYAVTGIVLGILFWGQSSNKL